MVEASTEIPDQIDRDGAIYNKGFIAGQEHSMPSKETLAMFKLNDEKSEKFREVLLGQVDEMRSTVKVMMNTLVDIKEQTIKTNGRVTDLERTKLRAEGGAAVLKAIWAIGGVFLIAMCFGLFQMYVTVANIDSHIEKVVTESLTR